MDEVFAADRRLLFSIAYRMLGSAADAEDVLQDAWLRYSSADLESVRSPKAFAATIVTRLCLDRLKSARVTREEYVGEWLPEPVLTAEVETPATMLQRAESLTLAFLVLLERLSPQERAVFVLKDIFEYEHAEVAEMLGLTVEHSRQLLHRAKARLAHGRQQLSGTPESRRAVATRFARAFLAGDGSELSALLAADVGVWADGGGKVATARHPVLGHDRVLHFLLGLQRAAVAAHGMREVVVQVEDVNSEPALVIRVGGRLESVFVFSIDGATVAGIRILRNPDKLAHIDRRLIH